MVFFKEDDKKSSEALLVLEEIDDDLDEVGIMFVKLDDEVRKLMIKVMFVSYNIGLDILQFQKEALEYGIEQFPTLVVFENGIPNLYDGGFESGEEVVKWIVAESTGDNTIEIVTDNMLDQIVATHDHVAVVFYKKGEEESETFIEMLEHIDDEANENEFPIKIVRWGKISS